ncbi:MAG: glycosyltransferase family 39 protein [Anaerolineae bacterium]|nr:glycosyltransferase family 39 protein [Anaerolineae bacterium]
MRGLRLLTIVALLAFIAFVVRAASLDFQSLWRDEVDALCYSYEFPALLVAAVKPQHQGPSLPCACPPPPVAMADTAAGLLPRLLSVLGGMIRQNGPLYYFILRGWIALAGTTEYGMRFLSLACGTLAVSLAYVLGRRLFDRRSGLLAALLVATSPYLTWYGQEAKMYALVLVQAMLALYALRRALDGGGWHWWAVQLVATTMAFYTHILAALLIPLQIVLYFVWWPRSRSQWKAALFSLGCLTLPYLPLAAWQAPSILQARATGFYPYTLDQMAQILLNGWSLGITGIGWPWGVIAPGVLAAWGLLRPVHRDERRNQLALACWIALPLVCVWLISLRQPLFTDRYLIWSAPAFYLSLSWAVSGLVQVRGWGRYVALVLMALIVTCNGANLWEQATGPFKSDFRSAAAYVASRYHPGELIMFQIPHGRYTFDYYFTVEGYPWADGLFTNHRAPDGSYLVSEQESAARMAALTSGYQTIWLVVTEAAMWDERGLVQHWLETQRTRVDEAHFMRVDVYRYE